MSDPSPIRYREYRPGPELAPVVEAFWTLRGPAGPGASPRRVLPDGCMDIILDLGGGSATAAGRPLRFVVGTMTTALTVRHSGAVDFVGVRFRSGAARALLAPPADDLTDDLLDLDALWGRAAAELWERMAHESRTDGRLALLAKTLQRRMGGADAAFDGVVRRAAGLLLWGQGPGPTRTVAGVAAELGVSRRHLERRFASEVGISPGRLGRVGRLQSAARIMWDEGERSLASVAVGAGYHDQPHMTREFRELAGVTPAAYRRELAGRAGRIHTSAASSAEPSSSMTQRGRGKRLRT